MRLLEDMLALSPWTRELSAEHLGRVRAAIIVREFEAGSTVCRKGGPASAWVGVPAGPASFQPSLEQSRGVMPFSLA